MHANLNPSRAHRRSRFGARCAPRSEVFAHRVLGHVDAQLLSGHGRKAKVHAVRDARFGRLAQADIKLGISTRRVRQVAVEREAVLAVAVQMTQHAGHCAGRAGMLFLKRRVPDRDAVQKYAQGKGAGVGEWGTSLDEGGESHRQNGIVFITRWSTPSIKFKLFILPVAALWTALDHRRWRRCRRRSRGRRWRWRWRRRWCRLWRRSNLDRRCYGRWGDSSQAV